MTIEAYLRRLRCRRSALLRWHPGDPLVLASIDYRLCCSPPRHWQEFYYRGNGRFICGVCERIQVA